MWISHPSSSLFFSPPHFVTHRHTKRIVTGLRMRDAKCCPGAFRGIDLSSLRKQFDQEMQIQGNAAQYVISVLNGLMAEDENNNFLSSTKDYLTWA